MVFCLHRIGSWFINETFILWLKDFQSTSFFLRFFRCNNSTILQYLILQKTNQEDKVICSICIFSLPGLLIVQDASERAALIPAGFSDGQFYSPPESEAGKNLIAICVFASQKLCPLYFSLHCAHLAHQDAKLSKTGGETQISKK